MKKMFSKIISVGLALVMTLICLQMGELKVEATANFTPRKTEPSTTDKYWIHTSYGGLNECMIINGNSCLPNCVGYAWGRAYEILGTRPNLSRGNAGDWYAYNISNNCYAYGSTPKLGAIACWGGHVAVVEEIYADGKVLLSQSHYGGKRFDPVVTYPPTYTSNFQGYIYIGEFNTPIYNYSSITPGNYFIISQSDGKSLTLANNEDWNTNNIHMYETMWNNRGQHMEIAQAPDGYKIRPIDSTRLVNPYGDYAAEGQNINIYADVNDSSQWWKFEKVGDSYIIHNAQNPNLVIDNADSSEAKLWTFNNGSNQKWLLIPAIAPDAPVVKGIKSSYTQSETIIADWDATYNTDRYDIGVAKYENGDYKWVFWQGNVTSKFNVSAAAELGAGEYRIRLESVNTKIPLGNGSAYLSTVGEYVYFSIKENAAAPKSYTIAFNANGGTGTMPNASMTVGVAKNLPANKFTRTGYTFLGWSTDKNAASPTYKDKQSVKDLAQSGTVTLYAIWQNNTPPTIRINNASAVIGQQISIPVYIDNAYVSSIIYSVKFDPRVLKFVSASEIPFMMYDINSKDAANGSVTVACLDEENFATGGKIAVYTFEVLAKNSCSTSIQLSVSEAADILEKPVTFKSAEAKIAIGSSNLGDVNDDGKVNLTDVRWILQSSSGSRAFTDAQRAAADVNKDGRINLTDARWLLQVASGSRKL